MNNTPDNNKYNDYDFDEIKKLPQNPQSQNSQGQFRAVRQTSQQTAHSNPQTNAGQVRQVYPKAQRTAQSQRTAQQTQRRPLNDEDRRRLEAARMAAMQNGGRTTDEEFRRRRQEQRYLNTAQPQTSVTSQRNPQNQASSRNTPPPQPNRRKKRIKINAGAVTFLLLIACIIGVSVNQINKNEENADIPKSDISMNLPDDAYLNNETDNIDEVIPEEIPVETSNANEASDDEPELNLTLYDKITIANTALDEGDLILVNYQYSYDDTDTVSLANVYNQRTSPVKVSTTSISMTAEALAALDALNNGMIAETACDDLLIVSGHRTVAEQQSIYDGYLASNGQDYVDQYVATPTYSEHHTGLACDLSFFTDDGYSVPIADHEFGYWLGENCAKYGYIRRYPEDKVDITKISYEAWHFRYVGVPHAYACTALDYCLEEYIESLTGYTADTKLLYIKADGTVADVDVTGEIPTSGGWLTYYVPMDEGENTEVALLRGDAYANYEISGNNVNGYIVTVTLP